MSTTRVFRRCHVCGKVCESETLVRRCQHCGKSFAPFYYFNDKFVPVLAEGSLRPPRLEGEYLLYGLTAYWDPNS